MVVAQGTTGIRSRPHDSTDADGEDIWASKNPPRGSGEIGATRRPDKADMVEVSDDRI